MHEYALARVCTHTHTHTLIYIAFWQLIIYYYCLLRIVLTLIARLIFITTIYLKILYMEINQLRVSSTLYSVSHEFFLEENLVSTSFLLHLSQFSLLFWRLKGLSESESTSKFHDPIKTLKILYLCVHFRPNFLYFIFFAIILFTLFTSLLVFLLLVTAVRRLVTDLKV